MKKKNATFIIAAVSLNGVIGLDNKLPWICKEDLQHFKLLTTGSTVIMGHNTFKSIGKALPSRSNIVISKDPELKILDCLVSNSLEDAVNNTEDIVFIIGGEQIYRESLQYADYMYITEIQKEVKGDTFFPEIDKTIWKETTRIKKSQTIPEVLEYHFVIYTRISSIKERI